MSDLLRALRIAATVGKVAANGLRVSNGDLEGLPYLIHDAPWDLLDSYRVGAGPAAKKTFETGREAWDIFRGKGPAIEVASATASEDPELDRFMKWLAGREWGVYIFLGPKGKGKTAKSLRLAEVQSQKLSRRVLGVNVWPEDGLTDVVTVEMEDLEIMTEIIKKNLRGMGMFGDWDDGVTTRRKLPEIPLENLKDLEIVVDESSLAMGNHGADKGRKIVRRLFGVARHMRWNVMFTTILSRQVPLDLFNAEAVFCMEPKGNEAWSDRPDTPEIVELWEDAAKGFGKLAQHPYRKKYPRNIAWAHVHCEDCDGRPFVGMMPFKRAGEKREAVDPKAIEILPALPAPRAEVA